MDAALALTDSIGRRIDYLRVSLTERCDLRCAYCRPVAAANGRGDALTVGDVVAIAEAAAELGICHLRLTGGEPLLRADLEEIIRRVRAIPRIKDLALTTNGQLLAGRAACLAAAGLMRVNISLDSLHPRRYAELTGGGEVANVVRGIEAALAADLTPVKVNVVLASPAGPSASELEAFAELARSRPVHVRFIEAMPTCGHVSYLPAQQLLDRLAQMGELRPVDGPPGGGPARYFRLDDSVGALGTITPISEPFCARCNRLRISARGELLPCLFSPSGISLLPALRGANPGDEVRALLRHGAAGKPCRWVEVADAGGIRAMHVIGG
ncbi:MAG: GTP 3',8-cyclase MoaA [Armatimonadota bacterium]